MTAGEQPDQRITNDDVDAAQAARYSARQSLETELRAELATTYRPGGIVARAVADELDRLADWHEDEFPDEYGNGPAMLSVEQLRDAAAEWRDGTR